MRDVLDPIELARNMVQSPDNWPPMRVKAVAQAFLSEAAARGKVEEALKSAAKQFRFYEREHMTKANLSAGRGEVGASNASVEKGNTNRGFAEMCDAALSSPSAEGGCTLTPHQTNERDE